jgi:hypothetical protein
VTDALGQDAFQNLLADAARRLRATRDTGAIERSNEQMRNLLYVPCPHEKVADTGHCEFCGELVEVQV